MVDHSVVAVATITVLLLFMAMVANHYMLLLFVFRI